MRNLFVNLSLVLAIALMPEIIRKTSYPNEFSLGVPAVSQITELDEAIRKSFRELDMEIGKHISMSLKVIEEGGFQNIQMWDHSHKRKSESVLSKIENFNLSFEFSKRESPSSVNRYSYHSGFQLTAPGSVKCN